MVKNYHQGPIGHRFCVTAHFLRDAVETARPMPVPAVGG